MDVGARMRPTSIFRHHRHVVVAQEAIAPSWRHCAVDGNAASADAVDDVAAVGHHHMVGASMTGVEGWRPAHHPVPSTSHTVWRRAVDATATEMNGHRRRRPYRGPTAVVAHGKWDQRCRRSGTSRHQRSDDVVNVVVVGAVDVNCCGCDRCRC